MISINKVKLLTLFQPTMGDDLTNMKYDKSRRIKCVLSHGKETMAFLLGSIDGQGHYPLCNELTSNVRFHYHEFDRKGLAPLTRDYQNYEIPFVGDWRGGYELLDIPLSNCMNSEVDKIYIFCNHDSHTLFQHVQKVCKQAGVSFFDRTSDTVEAKVKVLCASPRRSQWFQGTADAVRYFRWPLYRDHENVKEVLILLGAGVYRMDYRKVIEDHRKSGADITVACSPIDGSRASNFGLMAIDSKGRVLSFSEKPKGNEIKGMAMDTTVFGLSKEEAEKKPYIASTGVYVFNKELLGHIISEKYPNAKDIGADILPAATKEYNVKAYLFKEYWQDVGTIKSYFETSLAMIGHLPTFSFYDDKMPFFSTREAWKLPTDTRGTKIDNSMVSLGCWVVDSRLENSVVGNRSRVYKAHLKNTVMLGGTEWMGYGYWGKEKVNLGVGENTRISNCIIDQDASIGKNVIIENSEGIQEASRPEDGFYIRSGITVIRRNAVIEDGTII